MVRSILEDPVVHSKLLQDGFRSGFFLEDPAGVSYDGLEKLMYVFVGGVAHLSPLITSPSVASAGTHRSAP